MGNLRGAQEVTWRDVTLLVGRGQVFEFARARDRASKRRVGVSYRESERHNDNERSTEKGVHVRTDLVDYFCFLMNKFLSIPLWMIIDGNSQFLQSKMFLEFWRIWRWIIVLSKNLIYVRFLIILALLNSTLLKSKIFKKYVYFCRWSNNLKNF